MNSDILYQDPIATYNPRSFYDLVAGLPQVDFPAYVSALTPRAFPEKVIVTYPAYVNSLANILDDTRSEVLEAYFIVRAALKLSPNLGTGTDAWKAQRSLFEFLSGVKKGAVGDRAEFCVSKAEQTLGFAVGRYFVNETFGGDSKEKGTKVIKGERHFQLTYIWYSQPVYRYHQFV
jgi:endothelin-converting enzyme